MRVLGRLAPLLLYASAWVRILPTRLNAIALLRLFELFALARLAERIGPTLPPSSPRRNGFIGNRRDR
jgi:hypothetical protein